MLGRGCRNFHLTLYLFFFLQRQLYSSLHGQLTWTSTTQIIIRKCNVSIISFSFFCVNFSSKFERPQNSNILWIRIFFLVNWIATENNTHHCGGRELMPPVCTPSSRSLVLLTSATVSSSCQNRNKINLLQLACLFYFTRKTQRMFFVAAFVRYSTPGLSLRTESPSEYALKRVISVRRLM